MAIIERRLRSGSIVYRVELRDPNGKNYPKKQFARKIDAKMYEVSLLHQKEKGEVASKTNHRDITLSKYYDETWKIEARTKVTLGWRKKEDQMFRDHIKPYLGNAKLIDISKRDIAKLLAGLQEKGLGGQTTKHVYTILNGIFKYAIEISEIRESNPVLRKFKPLVKEYVPTYLKPEEARDFLDIVADHWLGPAIWIMVGTGIRVGELIGLQYGDLDLPGRKLYLRRQWRRSEKRIAPFLKNKKAEKPLPINDELVEYLEEKLSPLAKSTDWVIQSARYPGEMASYYTIYNTLKKLCADNKFPLLSPHGCRHTTSGIWNERGAKRDDLQSLYNHKDGSTTDRYNHEVPDRLIELARGIKMRKQKLHLVPVES